MQELTRRMLSLVAACAVASAMLTAPARALEKVKMSVFQSNFCCFAVYVAKHLKLFERRGIDVELVYGTAYSRRIFLSAAPPSLAHSRSSMA